MGTETKASRKSQAEETRRRILESAIEAFSEQHYDAVAVSDIAAAAGVAHGLLFHYYKNKRGIYLEAMREAARNLDASHEVNDALSPAEQVRQMYRGHLRYLARHRGLALRLVLGGRGADPEAWELFETDRWRSIEWVCGLVGLDPKEPALQMMLRTAAAALDEATAYWLEHDQVFDPSMMTEIFIDQTIAGLRGAAKLNSSLDVEQAIEQLHGESTPIAPRP